MAKALGAGIDQRLTASYVEKSVCKVARQHVGNFVGPAFGVEGV